MVVMEMERKSLGIFYKVRVNGLDVGNLGKDKLRMNFLFGVWVIGRMMVFFIDLGIVGGSRFEGVDIKGFVFSMLSLGIVDC